MLPSVRRARRARRVRRLSKKRLLMLLTASQQAQEGRCGQCGADTGSMQVQETYGRYWIVRQCEPCGYRSATALPFDYEPPEQVVLPEQSRLLPTLQTPPAIQGVRTGIQTFTEQV